MTKLIECPGCTRHVRVGDGRCPFCGRPSTTSAPTRVLALVLPLTLMACTGGEAPPAGEKPAQTKPVEVKPVEVKPVEVKPVEPIEHGPPQTSAAADDGAEIDEPLGPDIRIQATKYGGPPAMGDDGPAGPGVPEPLVEPDEAIEPEARPARKYGAPPRPEARPAKKYGAPPPPRPGDEPLG